MRAKVLHALGVPTHVPSWREQLVAVLSSTAGIALVAALAWQWQGSAPWLLASMGATAVLVFAVPHGPLSQPWAVLGGHLLSAVTALLLVRLAGPGVLADALAVGLAIAVMHLARCLHPPGGATALFIAQSVQPGAMPDWAWLLNPVLLNVAVILLAAVLLNYPFSWRRYPAALARQPSPPATAPGDEQPFTPEELARALDGLDEVIDISDEQLQYLYDAMIRLRPPGRDRRAH